MGTPGYVVFRYRNIYFAFFHRYNAYPDGLGIRVIKSMRQPGAIAILKQLLAETQDELSDILYPEESFKAGLNPEVEYIDGTMVLLQPDAIEVLKDRLVEALGEFRDVVRPDSANGNDTVSWTRPIWVTFEIDLDRNIFQVDDVPYFRLDCLPDEDDFLVYVNTFVDYYGNSVCAPDCPPCHKYERPAPPNVTDSELAMYQSSVCAGSHVTLSELLGLASDILSPAEQVRVSLLEIMIGKCMEFRVSQVIRQIEVASNHTQLTDNEWTVACSMANIAFIPQIFDKKETFINPPYRNRAEFIWVREDIVLCIATHLEDERCLQASMSRLINAISEQKNTPGDYFGVAFSVYHCAIIKVVKGEHATTFSHTDTLQFLPSFFGNSLSTPGIVAIARLACRIDPALFVRTMQICNQQNLKPMLHRWSIDNKASLTVTLEAKDTTRGPVLPVDIWLEIVPHLHVYDVLSLGLVSRVCRQAASMILHYPHICGFRLVAVPNETAFPLSHHESPTAIVFSAVRAGVLVDVAFGCTWQRWRDDLTKFRREFRREKHEDSMIDIPLQVSRKDPFDYLTLNTPFSAPWTNNSLSGERGEFLMDGKIYTRGIKYC